MQKRQVNVKFKRGHVIVYDNAEPTVVRKKGSSVVGIYKGDKFKVSGFYGKMVGIYVKELQCEVYLSQELFISIKEWRFKQRLERLVND